jgi:hypothetical protein
MAGQDADEMQTRHNGGKIAMSVSSASASASASAKHPNREVLSLSERIADPLFTIFAMSLLLAFFGYHQRTATGFFTEQFGPFAMLCLYGPIVLTPAAALVRAASGRRNPARPVEALTDLFMALAAIWLLIVFPFDFTHLADVLPAGLQFTLVWVTNDIGKIVLVLQIIIGTLVALFTLLKFFLVLGRQTSIASSPPSPPSAPSTPSTPSTPVHA